ncbi:MAG: hypothetical protein ABH843_03515 [Candidatus Omnitrophota bacterium]
MLRFIVFTICLSVVFIGCAEIEPPSPERILSPWSGVPPVRLGESKDSVRDSWGEPDDIRSLGTDETGLIKEEWTYRGRYPEIPVDYKYLSKPKRIIFTGESLTSYDADTDHGSPEKEIALEE